MEYNTRRPINLHVFIPQGLRYGSSKRVSCIIWGYPQGLIMAAGCCLPHSVLNPGTNSPGGQLQGRLGCRGNVGRKHSREHRAVSSIVLLFNPTRLPAYFECTTRSHRELASACISDHRGSAAASFYLRSMGPPSVLSNTSAGPKFVHSLLLESRLDHPILRHPAGHRPEDPCKADPSGGTGGARAMGRPRHSPRGSLPPCAPTDIRTREQETNTV